MSRPCHRASGADETRVAEGCDPAIGVAGKLLRNAARKFAASLEHALGLPVKLWDERLTSVQANRLLIEAGVSRARRKTKVDQSAAAILLQSYLDAASQTPPATP